LRDGDVAGAAARLGLARRGVVVREKRGVDRRRGGVWKGARAAGIEPGPCGWGCWVLGLQE